MPEADAAERQCYWRISNHVVLDGVGGLKKSGRWHTAGRRVVYLAENPAAALIEAWVHLELNAEFMPKPYTLLKIKALEDLAVETIPFAAVEGRLDQTDFTRALGDQWLAERRTALLRVPSAILPETFNMLLNPAHPEAEHVQVLAHSSYPWHPGCASVRAL